MVFSVRAHVDRFHPMADLPAERRQWVQEMRQVASAHGIGTVSDNADRPKVQTMAVALLACEALTGSQRRTVERAWGRYKDTFPEGSFTELGSQAKVPRRDFATHSAKRFASRWD